MNNRIIEISSDNVHLSLLRGFVKLTQAGQEIGRVGFPDIGGLIVRGYGASISLNLVARLAQEKIPLILCGPDQTPASIVWPISGHHGQGHIIEAQSSLSTPKKKRLWQSIVKAKITAQAQCLQAEDIQADDLFSLAKRVKSGDPENLEAQAAKRYWGRVFSTIDMEFSRDKEGSGINGWLNYGYAILRAGAARSVLAAGLHPSLSIHHVSRGEALRLTSDIMEPFRPWVDLKVLRLASTLSQKDPWPDLTPEYKSNIVNLLSIDLIGPKGASPLQTCLDRLAQSLAQICLGEEKILEFPKGLALKDGRMAV